MDNQLNFKRIKLLCHQRGTTMEQLSERLGRAYSGFRRACTVGSFNATEMVDMAIALDMTVADLYTELMVPDGASEDGAAYVRKRKLSGIKDPLEFLRALQQRSEDLDRLLDEKKPSRKS